MLDKCIVSSDTEVEGYFEVHDHATKDTLYFKVKSENNIVAISWIFIDKPCFHDRRLRMRIRQHCG
jgi:hypothetical protein